jgi:hypothetical protein
MVIFHVKLPEYLKKSNYSRVFFLERLNQPMVRQWLTVAAWSPSNLSKTKAGPWQFRRGLSGDAENDGTDLRHEGAAQE